VTTVQITTLLAEVEMERTVTMLLITVTITQTPPVNLHTSHGHVLTVLLGADTVIANSHVRTVCPIAPSMI